MYNKFSSACVNFIEESKPFSQTNGDYSRQEAIDQEVQ